MLYWSLFRTKYSCSSFPYPGFLYLEKTFTDCFTLFLLFCSFSLSSFPVHPISPLPSQREREIVCVRGWRGEGVAVVYSESTSKATTGHRGQEKRCCARRDANHDPICSSDKSFTVGRQGECCYADCFIVLVILCNIVFLFLFSTL